MKTIKPSTDLEIKQAQTFKAREEEKAIEQKAIEQLQNMPDLQKNILKTSFMEKMSLREAELKKVLTEIELKAFIFERVLYANKEQYPNLFREYQESKASW